MPKLPAITPKRFIRVLLGLGFLHSHTKGSHFIFHHRDGRKVIVPVHSRDIPKGTMSGMLKDIEISKGEFLKLLGK